MSQPYDSEAPRRARDGLLLIDKEPGCTSHDVVAGARRVLGIKKIGHCGTLDPDATGLLLLTVGRATRLTRFLIRAPKVYVGTARLGLTTDTYDLSGTVVRQDDPAALDAAAVEAAMERFVGTYLQSPPPYCARKVHGVKYYELARRGEAVPDEKKEVTVYELRPTEAWQPGRDLAFRLACSSGTYARSVIHELGQSLGCGAVLAGLRRTQVGSFRLEDSLPLSTVAERIAAGEELGAAWIPFDDIPLPFDEVVTDPQQERRIEHGQSVLVRDLEGQEGDWIKLVDSRRRFIAVGAVVEKIGTGGVSIVQPKVVFH